MNNLIAIKNRIQDVGLKATQQRIIILNALMDMTTHPTVEQVYNAIVADNPSISLATVYKTLESLYTHGLTAKVPTDEGLMRYDPRLENHGHIYCSDTKEIIDYYDEELNLLITNFFKQKKVNNLRIKNISLRINGTKVDPEKQIQIK